MPTFNRREILGLSAAGLLGACVKPHDTALRVGDQKGGQKAVLAASGNLDTVGYQLEWSQFPNAAPLLEALAAGAIDTGAGGDAAFIFAIGSGAPIKAIGGYRVDGLGTTIVVRRDSPIHKFEDLPGKRIATPRGSVGQNYLLAAMERLNKPYDAISFSFLGPSEGRAALQTGSVDAWAIWDPYSAIAEKTDGCRLIKGPNDLVPGCAFLFATPDAISTKRAEVLDLKHRLYRARDWANSNQQPYADMMHQETGIPLDILTVMVARARQVPIAIDDRVVAEQQKIADRYAKAGLLPKRFDVRAAFDSSFV